MHPVSLTEAASVQKVLGFCDQLIQRIHGEEAAALEAKSLCAVGRDHAVAGSKIPLKGAALGIILVQIGGKAKCGAAHDPDSSRIRV